MAFTRTFKVVALGHRAPDKGGNRYVINHDHTKADIRGYLVPGEITTVTSREFFSDIKSGDCLAADEETAKEASKALAIKVVFDPEAVDLLVLEERDKREKLLADAEAAELAARDAAEALAEDPGNAELDMAAANALRAAEAAAVKAGIRPPRAVLNGADKLLKAGE